jgi:hypothetical protein
VNHYIPHVGGKTLSKEVTQMKRLTAALLALAAIVVLASSVQAATAIKYKTVGPLILRMGVGSTTGGIADSSERNFNKTCVGGLVDTTASYGFDDDIVWGAVSDSLPILVMVRRNLAAIDGTTPAAGAADSVQVGLQLNWGGLVFAPVYTDTGNDWGGSTFALIGTSGGGQVTFQTGKTSHCLENAVNTYQSIGPGWGATQFRVLVRSTSVAACGGRYSVYVRYPIAVD